MLSFIVWTKYAYTIIENIGKPKELWKSKKSLGLKFERSISDVIALKMINPHILMLNIDCFLPTILEPDFSNLA